MGCPAKKLKKKGNNLTSCRVGEGGQHGDNK